MGSQGEGHHSVGKGLVVGNHDLAAADDGIVEHLLADGIFEVIDIGEIQMPDGTGNHIFPLLLGLVHEVDYILQGEVHAAYGLLDYHVVGKVGYDLAILEEETGYLVVRSLGIVERKDYFNPVVLVRIAGEFGIYSVDVDVCGDAGQRLARALGRGEVLRLAG